MNTEPAEKTIKDLGNRLVGDTRAAASRTEDVLANIQNGLIGTRKR